MLWCIVDIGNYHISRMCRNSSLVLPEASAVNTITKLLISIIKNKPLLAPLH